MCLTQPTCWLTRATTCGWATHVATCFPPSTTNCQQCSQHFGPSGTSAHTNSMLESRYREAKRCSASQHITLTLWEPEVYCRINKSLRLVTILSRTDPVHNLNFFFLRFSVVLCYNLCHCLQNGVLFHLYK